MWTIQKLVDKYLHSENNSKFLTNLWWKIFVVGILAVKVVFAEEKKNYKRTCYVIVKSIHHIHVSFKFKISIVYNNDKVVNILS